MGTHAEPDCDRSPYCYHCQAPHRLRSRDCPQYILEQDILHLANAQYISLGSARRELAFRQQRSGAATTYAATVASHPSLTPAMRSPSRVPDAARPAVPVRNSFAPLEGDESSETPGSTPSPVSLVGVVPSGSPSRPVVRKGSHKRPHGSADSVDLSGVRPTKVSVGQSDTTTPRLRVSVTPRRDSLSSPCPSSSSTAGDALAMPRLSASQELPLVDDDMPGRLVRQVSQESVASAGPSLVCDNPGSSLLSISATRHPVQRSGASARLGPSSKLLVSRSRPSSRGLPSSPIGTSAPSKPQRFFKHSSQVGKGKPLSGASSTSTK